jgi:hypothetical protein
VAGNCSRVRFKSARYSSSYSAAVTGWVSLLFVQAVQAIDADHDAEQVGLEVQCVDLPAGGEVRYFIAADPRLKKWKPFAGWSYRRRLAMIKA